MRERLTLIVTVFAIIFILSCVIQNSILSSNTTTLTFSIVEVYAFFGLFSLTLSLIFIFLAQKAQFKDQLGFLYLGSVIAKMVLFSIIFYRHLFGVDSLPDAAIVNMLTPLFLSLIFEVLFMVKMLKYLPAIKNE